MKYVSEDLKTLANNHKITLYSGKVVTCKLKFCADGKFLLAILGMKSATADQSCPFCLLSKKQWAQALMPNCPFQVEEYAQKSVTSLMHFKNDTMCCIHHKNAKTCAQAASNSSSGSHSSKVGLPNLLEGIGLQLEDIVIDELHMFMRLFENLLERFLYYLEEYNLEIEFETLIQTKMNGITFHLEEGLTEDGIQCWSYLNGDMAWNLLEGLLKIDPNTGDCLLASVFYVGERSSLIHVEKRKKSEKYYEVLKVSFTALHNIFLFLRHKNGPISTPEQYQAKVNEFCQTQIKFFGPDISRGWYFHLLGCHSMEILKLCEGSILRFSCSPQERMNGIHGKQIVNCVMNQNSAFEILKLMRRDVYFDFVDNTGAKIRVHKYKENRMSFVYTGDKLRKKKKLDQITQLKTLVKKRKEMLSPFIQ